MNPLLTQMLGESASVEIQASSAGERRWTRRTRCAIALAHLCKPKSPAAEAGAGHWPNQICLRKESPGR